MHCSHFCKTLRQCLMFHTLRGFLFTTVSQIHPRTELCHCSCLLWGGTFTSCKSIICFLLSQKTEIFHRELALSSQVKTWWREGNEARKEAMGIWASFSCTFFLFELGPIYIISLHVGCEHWQFDAALNPNFMALWVRQYSVHNEQLSPRGDMVKYSVSDKA